MHKKYYSQTVGPRWGIPEHAEDMIGELEGTMILKRLYPKKQLNLGGKT